MARPKNTRRVYRPREGETAMLTRSLLVGVVLALLLVGVLSACSAQGGISILPTEAGGGASGAQAIPDPPARQGPITVLVALVVTALVVAAIASLRP
jgi:hypothetical protein